MRSALNIGFTLGALLGGLALATNSDSVIRMVPLMTAAVLGLNALLITRLPSTSSTTTVPVVRKQLITPARCATRASSPSTSATAC